MDIRCPLLLSLNTSITGWDAHLLDHTVAGIWLLKEKDLQINVLEMKAVQLALNAFLTRIAGELVILMRDTATVVIYLKKQGGTVFKVMCNLAPKNCDVVGDSHGVDLG